MKGPTMESDQRKARAALLSVTSNTLLVVAKLLVGYVVGSVSIISEAIHSGVDLVAALIAYAAVRAASKPADIQHPYGHGKIENLSGAVEAALIAIAGVWIIIEAAERLFHPTPIEQPLLGLFVMGLSATVNIAVSRYLFRVAKETHSVALEADAWHLRTDVWTSIGIMGGFVVVTLAHYFAPQLSLGFIDPACALIVALLIMKAAWDLTAQSLGDLLDESLPAWEREDLDSILRKFREILGVHSVRTRKNGVKRFIELHLVVHPEMTVETAHRLQHDVQTQIRDRLGEVNLLAHVEPCDRRCPPQCRAGCWSSPTSNPDPSEPPRVRREVPGV
jgi:cation diffusion facilitator family transporter